MISQRQSILFIALTLSFGVPAAQAKTLPYRFDCDHGKGASLTQRIDEITVQITPDKGLCYLLVSDGSGDTIFKTTSWGLQVSSAIDLAGDGRKSVLIQVDSDPYELIVLSVGPHPGIIARVQNGYGFWIQDGCADHRWHVATADSVFQNDKELTSVYHHDLFVPTVVLGLRGNQFFDATPRCKDAFDLALVKVRAGLSRRKIAAFRNGTIKDEFDAGRLKGQILYLAFTNLYTARESAAKAVLQQMWPAGDVERIWLWMRQKHSEGLLAHLAS